MKTAKYFSAPWCGPCKAFKPIMNEIKSEGYYVEFIDIDNMSDLASKYNVRSVPTVVIEEGGVEVDRVVGMQTKSIMLERMSYRFLETISLKKISRKHDKVLVEELRKVL